MRPSSNNGEDKPPLNLSNSITQNINSSNATENLSSSTQEADSTVNTLPDPSIHEAFPKSTHKDVQFTEEHGSPLDVPSTGTPQNGTAERSTTLGHAPSTAYSCEAADCHMKDSATVKQENETACNDHGTTNSEETVAEDGNYYPEGGLAAWLVVFGSFIGMVACFGILNSVGTFQAYLSTHQLAHHSPSSVGWIFSIFAFLTFFCGVQIGPIFDAKGPQWLVAAGTVFLFAGLMGVAESTKLWHFILTFSILSGLGSSLIFTPAVGAIAHWFFKRRAAATGLATTGGSIGGIIFPLMLQRLFPLVGFRWATRILAFIFIFLLAIANFLIRTRLTPHDRAKMGENGIAPTNIRKDIWPDFRIFRNVVFSLTTAGVFFIEWALFIPLSYISSYALSHGVNSAFSYQLLAILNVGSFFGRWAPGFMADKMGRFNTMIATVALCLASVLCLWLTCSPEDGAGGVAQLVIFCLVFGFASGSNISLTPVCVGQLCGTEVFGRWFASLYTIVSLGCLTGIPIAGQLIATDGGRYTGLIAFVGGCYGLGLVCFVWARVLKVGWGLGKIY